MDIVLTGTISAESELSGKLGGDVKETFVDLAQESKASADAAAKSAAAAERSAGEAQAAKQASETAANDAGAAADRAEQAAGNAETSAAQAAGAVAEHNQSTDAHQDLFAAITPDDSAVGGKTWPSKKTVDVLCQPIDETGNPVQCYPVEGYPLGVKVRWEPVQEGEGDPSPENVRPIAGINSVKILRCGKNILRFTDKSATSVGVNFVSNADGSIHISGKISDESKQCVFYFGDDDFKKEIYTVVKSGKNFTLSGVPEGISFCIFDNNWKGREFKAGVSYSLPADMGHPDNIYFRVLSTPNPLDATYYPQLEVGDNQTEYEPYRGDVYNITMPETVYGGELDVEAGVLTVNCKSLVIDGSSDENIASSGVSNKGINRWELIIPDCLPYTKGKAFSSHYKYYIDYNSGGYYTFYNSGNRLILFDSSVSTVDEFRQKLNASPITFVYPITPITHQLNPQQITALSGVNTIYTDANGLVVTGREDPAHTITELKNAIIGLGGNI